MADSSSADDGPVTQSQHEQQPTIKHGARIKNDLDERQTPTDLDGQPRLPAWKLREQMKNQHVPDNKPSITPRGSLRTKAPGIDPNLPPAFREAFTRQRKKEIDDFMSLDSVHSSKTQMSILTENVTDNSDSGDDSSSFDGDSFASLGEDSDDDEALRESRNQIARQRVENSPSRAKQRSKSYEFRLKGTPLDFIAE